MSAAFGNKAGDHVGGQVGPESAVVVRWLCHDMANPVSTLLTASELLADSCDSEINGLITEAIRKLAARLRMVRMAMGSSSTLAQPALEKLLAEALTETPVRLALSANTAVPGSLVAGAALILSELAARAALFIDDKGAHWTDGRMLPENAVAALEGRETGDARSAMIALVAAQARVGGWVLEAQASGLGFQQAG